MNFDLKTINGRQFFEFTYDAERGVTGYFTTKKGLGDFNTDDGFHNAFAPFFNIINLSPEKVRYLNQVHGSEIFHVSIDNAPLDSSRPLGEGDALTSNEAGIALGIKVADCLSIQLYDPISLSIANVHSGWRSAAANILTLTIAKMIKKYRFSPSSAIATLLPSISKVNYEVGPDVYKTFTDNIHNSRKNFITQPKGKWLFDLKGITKDLLMRAGVHKENIHDLDMCTYDRNDIFYSYRKDKGLKGRMLSLIVRKH